jgi:hypothetical protein
MQSKWDELMWHQLPTTMDHVHTDNPEWAERIYVMSGDQDNRAALQSKRPSPAKRAAVARLPLAAPVVTATLPLSFPIVPSLFDIMATGRNRRLNQGNRTYTNAYTGVVSQSWP